MDGELHDILASFGADLKTLFIVSQAKLVKGEKLEEAHESAELEGVYVKVAAAEGEKCQRCWIYDTRLGENEKYPGACPKCSEALEAIG